MSQTSMPAWTDRTVSRGDVDLAVVEAGDPSATPVVLVHGWPDTHLLWTAVAARLVDDLRVVAYDTRGQGRSPTGASDTSFTLPHLAADLMAVLDDVSPDRPVHLVGHDWGSVQAWEAVCEPGADARIASFTSISGPNLDHVAAWMRDVVRHPSPRGIAEVVAQAVSSSYVPFLVSPLAPPVLRTAAGRDRWRLLVRLIEGQQPPAGSHAPSLGRDIVSGLRYYRANTLSTTRSRERRTRVPVLQLALTRDPAIREASLRASDRWCETLERRHLTLGHWAPLTSPDVVADEVLRFIRAAGSTS